MLNSFQHRIHKASQPIHGFAKSLVQNSSNIYEQIQKEKKGEPANIF